MEHRLNRTFKLLAGSATLLMGVSLTLIPTQSVMVSAESVVIKQQDFVLTHNADNTYTLQNVEVPEGKYLIAGAPTNAAIEVYGGTEAMYSLIKTQFDSFIGQTQQPDTKIGLNTVYFECVDITSNQTFSFSTDCNPDAGILVSIAYEFEDKMYTAETLGLCENIAINESAYNKLGTKTDVEGIILNKSSMTLKCGGETTLSAVFNPSNATDKRITWTSSDENVVTVDLYGKVTAVATGTATITATTTDGGKVDTCTVKVEHNYGTPTYSWEGNKCTAQRVCEGDATHIEKETVTGIFVKDTDATCTEAEKGHYKATFENTAFVEQVTEANSVIGQAATGHTVVKHDAKAPQVGEAGHKEYFECSVCHEFFEDEGCTSEIASLDQWKQEGGNGYLAPLQAAEKQPLVWLWTILGILLLLIIIYILGYFFLYRKGRLDDKAIRVIYKWLPRGNKNKEENN